MQVIGRSIHQARPGLTRDADDSRILPYHLVKNEKDAFYQLPDGKILNQVNVD
jgi:hypothetical protein